MEIQITVLGIQKKKQNLIDKKTGWGFKEPGSNTDVRTSLALPFASLYPFFIFSFPFFFLLSLRGKVSSIVKDPSHRFPLSAGLCHISFIWITLLLHFPLLAYSLFPTICLKFPILQNVSTALPMLVSCHNSSPQPYLWEEKPMAFIYSFFTVLPLCLSFFFLIDFMA